MKFYDTSALLDLPPDTLLAQQFLIADITLYELEDIKTSGKKDEATKAKARAVTRLLAEHPTAYTVVSIDYQQLLSILNDVPVKDNNDGTIMAAARWYLNELQNKLDETWGEVCDVGSLVTTEDYRNQKAEIDSFRFVTSDLSCFCTTLIQGYFCPASVIIVGTASIKRQFTGQFHNLLRKIEAT